MLRVPDTASHDGRIAKSSRTSLFIYFTDADWEAAAAGSCRRAVHSSVIRRIMTSFWM